MNSPKNRVDDIFWIASEIDSAAARDAYLVSACGDDSELRKRVEELLQARPLAQSYLEQPAAVIATAGMPPLAEKPGTQIGPYKLLQQIGEGGFGVVYMAEQITPMRRKVALKIIKPGMDTKDVIARFEGERQALALMDHPNVAKVLDAGTTHSGRPYFVMELVHGVPITDFCDDQRLTSRERLPLFVDVCRAVQHAHQKGIIHRDLKPANVMVTMRDDRPIPKVIDFGVSKAVSQQLTEKTLFTAYGQMIGTPMYMSPEQTQMSEADVDTRSDVYSLGVLLYELLTGTTPFDREVIKRADYDELRRIIREDEPLRPSDRVSTLRGEQLSTVADRRRLDGHSLSQSIRGELDWIVMKALEKDRSRRFESASAFAADVQRFLNDEPVLACPPSTWYRLRKAARRNKALLIAATATLAVVLTVAGTIGLFAGQRMAEQQETEEQVSAALQAAEEGLQNEDWDQARIALTRAESLAPSLSAEGIHRTRLRQIQQDLKAVADIERVRGRWNLVSAAALDLPCHSGESASVYDRDYDDDASYAELFREYGIDVDGQPAAVAAEAIRRSSIRSQLIAALDRWSAVRRGSDPEDVARWTRPLEAARLADQDSVRNEIRRKWELGDHEGLVEIAESPATARMHPVTVLRITQALFKGGRTQRQRDAAVQLARSAQLRHPNDFFLNLRLCGYLNRTTPPQFEEALRYGQAALALKPSDSRALGAVGDALRHLKRSGEAIALYQRAVELDPQNPVGQTLIGAILEEQGKLDEAIVHYRKSIAIDSSRGSAFYRLGGALRRKGEFDAAISAVQASIQLNPDFACGHDLLGRVLWETGEREAAVAAYRRATQLEPQHADHYNQLATALCKEGQPAEAILALQKGIELDRHYALLHANLGTVLHDQGHVEQAIAELSRAIELGPTSPIACNGLGVIAEERDQLCEALDWYRKASEAEPENTLFLKNVGLVLTKQEKFHQAVAAFRQVIEIDPHDVEAHKYLGEAYREQKKFTDAFDAYKRAGEADPHDATIRFALGNICRSQRQWPEALYWYREAIRLDPQNSTYCNNVGVVLHAQGKLDQAIEAYHKAIELDPNDAVAHRNLGLALDSQGKRNEAVAALRMSIELDPGCTRNHLVLGFTLQRLGQLEGATKEFKEALSLDPHDAVAADALGCALRFQGRLLEAVAVFEKAIELHPEAANLHANLGGVQQAQGNYEAAIASCERATEADPSNPAGCNGLAWLLATCADPSLQDPRRAVELAKKAVRLSPAGKSQLNTLGVAHYRAEQWPEAIDVLRQSMASGQGGDSFDWFFLAMAHWRQGERDEARKWYQRAVEWMDANAPQHDELIRFRAEAAELLRIGDQSTKRDPPPVKTSSAENRASGSR